MIGRVFADAYRVEAVLGAGGFGTVYRASQLTVGRPVAVKVLRPDLAHGDPDLRERLVRRFRREAHATSRLAHPHTVQVIDFGEAEDGTLFLVLEHLVGRDLAQVLEEEGPLEPARIARIAQQVCRSLAEAHDAGIVHRDLKPSNVFLCRYDGSEGFVKVMDFGIASVAGHEQEQAQITRTGVTQGTPRYMSPEQALAKATGPATDMYALGCIVYELLTGRPAFDGPNPLAVCLAHIQQAPPELRLEEVSPELARAWAKLVAGLLLKQPAGRQADARKVAEELGRLANWDVEQPRTRRQASFSDRRDAQALQTMEADLGDGIAAQVETTMGLVMEDTRPRRRRAVWPIGAVIGLIVLLGAAVGIFAAAAAVETGDPAEVAVEAPPPAKATEPTVAAALPAPVPAAIETAKPAPVAAPVVVEAPEAEEAEQAQAARPEADEKKPRAAPKKKQKKKARVAAPRDSTSSKALPSLRKSSKPADKPAARKSLPGLRLGGSK